MKFLHAADLHLDSPLSGLPGYEGAPTGEVRGATRRALENLVERCRMEQAELLVLAGDLYDGDWRDYSTGLFFVRQMARLGESGTRVVWIRGNHDAQSQLTRHLSLPGNVRELSVERAETLVFDDLGVAIHGMGYATRDVTENLAAHYPAPVPGAFNLGLLHTALDGRSGHAGYAPCTLDQLRARGYQYWALGHVHQREIVSEEPFIVFPGNLQGRHIKETGEKGATLVEVVGSEVQSMEHVALDVVRWSVLEVDVTPLASFDDVLDEVERGMRKLERRAEPRTLALRVRLVGRSGVQAALDRDRDKLLGEVRARSLGAGSVYVESLEIAVEPEITRRELDERRDALGGLFRAIAEERALARAGDRRFEARLLEGLDAVPRELLVEVLGDVTSRDSAARDVGLERVLGEAERMLLSRLIGGGGR